MKYTYQEVSESWIFSQPEGNDVSHAGSFAELRTALEQWQRTHGRVGADESAAYLVVWVKAHLDDITDVYPDFILKAGPRGGVIKESC